MKKNCIKMLLAGTLTVCSATAITSCSNDDVDDLKVRVTALEGKIHELNDQLQAAMTTGATITDAQNNNGVWTLTLSDGKVITITPASTESTSIKVEETQDAFVITINKDVYAIPKVASAAINSLIYVPEYEDGMVMLGNDGAEVKFLSTPSLTAADIENASFEIADARELKSRAGENLMKVEKVEIESGLLKITIKGLAVKAGQKYVAAVKATIKGTAISSNYFNIIVSNDFMFESEVLEEPAFISGTEVEADGKGFHSVLIPNSAIVFATGFNLKDYYASLPAGNIAFQLAPAEMQNASVQDKYEILKASLTSDGSFAFTERPGTDFSDEEKDGILIYMTANDVIKNKVYWKINDPIPGLDLPSLKDVFGEAPHMEWGYSGSAEMKDNIYLEPGKENAVSFPMIFNQYDKYLGIRHDGSKFVEAWAEGKMCAAVDGEDLFFTDGDNLILGDYGKKITADGKLGRGIWWQSTQPSIISSNRRNWDMTDDEKKAIAKGECNGEIIGGWDGISGEEFTALGFVWDSTGWLRTSKEYTGVGARIGVGLRFEYAYGNVEVCGWHLCYLFFNRRVCAEGVVDPSAR